MHRPASRYFVRHVSQLLLGVSMAALGPALALAQPVADPAQPTVLAPITLDAADLRTGTIDAPAAPYAGGQVSTQVRLGALGNRDAQSAPFRVTGFTEALIQDQQAISLGDLVSNDPSIRQDAPTFSERDSFFIRGFSVTNLDTLFDGLPYLANPRRSALEGIAQVDVLMGPTALANGGVGRVGGTINLVPKRAGDQDLTQLTTSILSDSQVWTHLDVGRRFGTGGEWGLRANGSWRAGDSALDNNSVEVGVATLGLDYRGDRLRASLDASLSNQNLDAPTSLFNAALPGIDIPDAPDGKVNTANPFEYHDSSHRMIAGRLEYDIRPDTTIYAAAGASRYREDFLTSNYVIQDADGDALNTFGYNPQQIQGFSGEVGLRSQFMTGSVGHALSLSAARSVNENDRGRFNPRLLGFPENPTNIYDPVYLPDGSVDTTGLPRSGDLIPFADLTVTSIAVSDTLSFDQDRLQLTIGGRYQTIRSRGFNTRPGIPEAPVGERNYLYEDEAFTPAVAASYRITDGLSVYANYVEALTEGQIAPTAAVNAGEIFPATVNRQREVGLKYDTGTVALGAALFEIRQPNGITDPATNVFSVGGQQRNRGLELSVAGEPMEGLRLLGGVTFLDATLVRTQDGAFDGKDAPGIPDTAISLYAEYDTPGIRDLTLTGRLMHGGSTWYDQANTQKVDGWTRLDLGVRYAVARADGRDIQLRAQVENVLDENYWATSARGFLSTGAPRTYSVSASIRF